MKSAYDCLSIHFDKYIILKNDFYNIVLTGIHKILNLFRTLAIIVKWYRKFTSGSIRNFLRILF
jgi:hypothetical protein